MMQRIDRRRVTTWAAISWFACLLSLSKAGDEAPVEVTLAVNQPAMQAYLESGANHAYRITIAVAGRYRISSEGYTQVSLRLFGPGDAVQQVNPMKVGPTKESPDLVNLQLNFELMAGEYSLRVASATAGGAGEYGIRVASAARNDLTRVRSPQTPGDDTLFGNDAFMIDPAITKIALLVGINRYQNGVLAPELAGCENDVDDVKDLLVRDFQFPSQNVLVLKSKQATRQRILTAFRQHLIGRARFAKSAGAQSVCCVFHFSGHGGRMTDSEPFKDEADGIDETILPHDAYTTGVFEITDDEIFLLSAELARFAKNVTFIFDSGQAGDVMKGVGRRRSPGRERPAPSSPRPFYDDPSVTIPVTPPAGFNDLRDSRHYAFIAGSQEEQSSYEIEREGLARGSLTYFLTGAIRAARQDAQGKVTYRAVMEHVKANVRGEYQTQIPYVSGEKLDDIIFGDESFRPSTFTYARLEGTGFKLEAGQFHGVTKESHYDVYPPGTIDFDAPALATARAVVTNVYTLEAEAAIRESVRPEQLATATPETRFRAVERRHAFGDAKVTISMPEPGTPILAKIRAHLENSAEFRDQFRFVESGPARLMIEMKEDKVHFTRGGEKEPFSSLAVAAPDLLDAVGTCVHDWSRWDRVRQIQNPRTGLQVEFTLTPQATNLPPSEPGSVGHIVPDGTRFKLLIVNHSGRKLYLYLLDVLGDGRIKKMVADRPIAAHHSFDAEVTFTFPKDHVGQRFHEMLKLFVTEKRIDITPLLIRGAKGKSDDNPLARLLNRAGMASKDAVVHIDTEDWTTIAYEVELVRPQSGAAIPESH
jgi:hypothetical protein